MFRMVSLDPELSNYFGVIFNISVILVQKWINFLKLPQAIMNQKSKIVFIFSRKDWISCTVGQVYTNFEFIADDA